MGHIFVLKSFREFFISGARVVYNLQNQPGNRVVSLDVRCLKCQVPTYSPIEMDAVYDILLADWLANAGDGYKMIKDNIIERIQLSMCDSLFSGFGVYFCFRVSVMFHIMFVQYYH